MALYLLYTLDFHCLNLPTTNERDTNSIVCDNNVKAYEQKCHKESGNFRFHENHTNTKVENCRGEIMQNGESVQIVLNCWKLTTVKIFNFSHELFIYYVLHINFRYRDDIYIYVHICIRMEIGNVVLYKYVNRWNFQCWLW